MKKNEGMKAVIFAVILGLFLASCASREPSVGRYKIGKPYQVEGKWYEPKQQDDYDEVGMASWYGSSFHKKETANGGKFDKNVLSAAHKTLPLPSMVKVTNLENNKTLIVMVNDRGPFANNRILDLSERAAEILGFKDKGITKVRVQYLPGQTKRLLSDLPGIKGDKQAKDVAVVAPNESAGPAGASANLLGEKQANQFSRVFTSTANEGELKEPVAKVKNSAIPADSDNSAPDVDVAPADSDKPLKKAEGVSQDVQYIQAGTYGVKGNAQRVEKALASIGTVSIVPVTINGKALYKVKVGPILDKKVAELSLKKVITLGHPDAMLVKETAMVSE